MTLASGTTSRSKSGLQSFRCRTAERTLVMMSASCSVVLTLCSVIGRFARKRKRHGDARALLMSSSPLPSAARHPRSHHKGTGFKRQASSAPSTRSMALAARPHSIDSASVELVLCSPCRRLGYSIKKELPLDPVILTFVSPKASRAKRRIAEGAESQLLPIVICALQCERPCS